MPTERIISVLPLTLLPGPAIIPIRLKWLGNTRTLGVNNWIIVDVKQGRSNWPDAYPQLVNLPLSTQQFRTQLWRLITLGMCCMMFGVILFTYGLLVVEVNSAGIAPRILLKLLLPRCSLVYGTEIHLN